METLQAYLVRKHEELKLLNECLRKPLSLACPQSVADVIQRKFQLTAALKAEHALRDWATTETAWAHSARPESGPFKFSYDYQRADLDVQGPSFYQLGDDRASETIYTASGMAAISAVLLASAQVIGDGDILVLPGSYGETQELIEGYARHLRLIRSPHEPRETSASKSSTRLLLLDSATPAREFEAALGAVSPAFDLLIFDTTCFAASSIRIRRVINRACRQGVPVLMVRSHTKLDSLGAEYGRLGSVTFVNCEKTGSWACRSRMAELPGEVRNAIRLLGGAALPAHFPPYIGSQTYHLLTQKRLAAILRNSRRSGRYFRTAVPDPTEESRFAHGLYLTLKGSRRFDEAAARRTAAELGEELGRASFPIRHAGSFGFDFAATEWFHNPATDRYSVRVAVPDLPSALWDELAASIAQWWSIHQGRGVSM